MRRTLSIILIFSLLFQQVGFAQPLPVPASLNSIPQPPLLKYLSVNSANPNNYFNFLMDKGSSASLRATEGSEAILSNKNLTTVAKKLINYFFLGLTIPSSSFWVNLQPNQQDRITSVELAKTDLGRTLLEQDLQLKKDMANYLHPQNPVGKVFWTKLYESIERSQVASHKSQVNIKNLKIQTNNRVWIVPDKAVVVETEDGALVAKATLKVLLENEYKSVMCQVSGVKDKSALLRATEGSEAILSPNKNDGNIQLLSEQLMKQIIIPEITKQVNESPRYAPLRQVYYSLILAEWYKKKIKSPSHASQVTSKIENPKSVTGLHPKGRDLRPVTNPYSTYLNSSITQGLESQFPWSKDALFQDYMKSYTKGEYNIKDTIFGLKRMYFSGGIIFDCSSPLEVIGIKVSSPVPEEMKKLSLDKVAIVKFSGPVVNSGNIFSGNMEITDSERQSIRKDNFQHEKIIEEQNKLFQNVVKELEKFSFLEKKDIEVPFIIPDVILEDSARDFGYDLKIEQSLKYKKNREIQILSQGKIIGTFIIKSSLDDPQTLISLFDSQEGGKVKKWLIYLCDINKILNTNLWKKYEERRVETENNPAIKNVFDSNQSNFEKFPFLQTTNRSLDEVSALLDLDVDKILMSEFSEKLSKDGVSVLDVGCGDGTFLRSLREKVGGIKSGFTGVSPINNPLNAGDGISFYQGYAEILPEEWTNKFDFITCVESLYLMADPARAIEEMFRVLAPGGMLVVYSSCKYDLRFNKQTGNNVSHFGKLIDYLIEMGYSVATDGNSFIIKKTRYNLPLIYPVVYKESSYTTYSAYSPELLQLKVLFAKSRDYQQIKYDPKDPLVLFANSIYEFKDIYGSVFHESKNNLSSQEVNVIGSIEGGNSSSSLRVGNKKRDLIEVYDDKGELVNLFEEVISPAEFSKLDKVTIKGYRLDNAGRLTMAKRAWIVMYNYPLAPVEIDVRDGLITEVRILNVNKDVIDSRKLAYDKDRNIVRDAIRGSSLKVKNITLQKKLSSKGRLSVTGNMDTKFPDYPNAKVAIDFEGGIIKEIRILDKDGSVLKTVIPTLIYNKKKLIRSYMSTVRSGELKELSKDGAITIKNLKFVSGALFVGGISFRRQDYVDNKADVEIRNGILTKLTVFDGKGKIAEVIDLSLVYVNGILIDSFDKSMPVGYFNLDKITVKTRLYARGEIPFSRDQAGHFAFSEYPNAQVEIDMQKGIITQIRILGKDNKWIKKDMGLIIKEGGLLGSVNVNLTKEKLAKLGTVTLKNFRLDNNGSLFLGGRGWGTLSDRDDNIDVEIKDGFVVTVRILNNDSSLRKEYNYAVVYNENGKIIDSFIGKIFPERFKEYGNAVIRNFELGKKSGGIRIGGQYWGTLGDNRAGMRVCLEIENGEVVSVFSENDEVLRIRDQLGMKAKDLFPAEIKFREILKDKFINYGLPSGISGIIANKLVRMHQGELEKLVKYGMITLEDKAAIERLELGKLGVEAVAKKIKESIDYYRKINLSDYQINTLISRLVPYNIFESFREKSFAPTSLITRALGYASPEKWIDKYTKEALKTGELPSRNINLYKQAKAQLSKEEDILIQLQKITQVLKVLIKNQEGNVPNDNFSAYAIQSRLIEGLISNLKSKHTTGYPLIDRILGLRVEAGDTNLDELKTERLQFIDSRILYSKAKTKGDQSQETAVLLGLNPKQNLVLIQGPPGTGKTTVITEIARQLVRQGKKVLIVCQMNRALDHVLSNLVNDQDVPVLRLGNDFKNLNSGIAKIWSQNTRRGEGIDLFQQRIGTKRGYAMGGTCVGFANDRLLRNRNIFVNFPKFDVVIMDEASRATVIEAFIPLTKADKAIIVGDHKQLSAFGIEENLVKKLGFKNDEVTAFNQSIFDLLVDKNKADQIMLSTSWRLPPVIAGLVSFFYDGELRKRGWGDFDADTLKIIDTAQLEDGPYPETSGYGGVTNSGNLRKIEETIDYYVKYYDYKPEDFTVITAYAAQQELLLSRLKQKKVTQVSTIDSYQGRENKVIILDLVRSNPAPHKIGFLKDLRRLNVSASRALERMVIIGDFTTLTNASYSPEDLAAAQMFKQWQSYYETEVLSYFVDSNEVMGEADKQGSSPLAKGGIDLSQIDVTLQDEKFVSNFNPADFKILLAAKALRQGASLLSLLRVHEVMGYLRDKVVKPEAIQNQKLFKQVLLELRLSRCFDFKALSYLKLLERGRGFPLVNNASITKR